MSGVIRIVDSSLSEWCTMQSLMRGGSFLSQDFFLGASLVASFRSGSRNLHLLSRPPWRLLIDERGGHRSRFSGAEAAHPGGPIPV